MESVRLLLILCQIVTIGFGYVSKKHLSDAIGNDAPKDQISSSKPNSTKNPCDGFYEYACSQHVDGDRNDGADLRKQKIDALKYNKESKLSYVGQLKLAFNDCLLTRKTSFHDDPLVRRIFETCGGESILRQDSDVSRIDIAEVVLALKSKFGVGTLVEIFYGGRIEIDILTHHPLTKEIVKKYVEMLSPDSNSDAISRIATEVLKVQEAWYNKDFLYGKDNEVVKLSQLKKRRISDESGINWYTFVRRLITVDQFRNRPFDINDVEILVRSTLFGTADSFIAQNNKISILLYLFFAALDTIKSELQIDVSKNDSFTESECFTIVSRAKQPFYSYYYRRTNYPSIKAKVDDSVGKMRKHFLQIIDRSPKLDRKIKKIIKHEIISTTIVAAYPEILMNKDITEIFFPKVTSYQKSSFFEKASLIMVQNNNFLNYLTTSKPFRDYIWYHKNGFTPFTDFSHYEKENVMIIRDSYEFLKDTTSKKFQPIDFLIAKAFGEAITRRLIGSQDNGLVALSEYFPCLSEQFISNNMNESTDPWTFAADSISMQLAFSAFENGYRQRMNRMPTLEDSRSFFTLSTVNYCGADPSGYLDPQRFYEIWRNIYETSVDASISNVAEFSTVFQCPKTSKMNTITKCRLF